MAKLENTTVVITDFDELAQRSDQDIIARFVFACRSSKKRLVPKATAAYGAEVQRKAELLSIGLFNSQQKLIGTFSFAPVRFR